MYFMFENMVRALSKFKKRRGITFFHKLYKNYIECVLTFVHLLCNYFLQFYKNYVYVIKSLLTLGLTSACPSETRRPASRRAGSRTTSA